METIKLKIKDFKSGTILWLKLVMVLIVILGVSYFVSKVSLWWGVLLDIYLAILGAPALIINNLLLAFLIFPVYLFFLANFITFSRNNKCPKWFKLLFWALTIAYIIAIPLGWIIGTMQLIP